jgi:hypothetical protein
VIAESHCWKRELLRIAARLTPRLKQRRWAPASSSAVKKDVMIGFYIVRKLVEARKVSDSVAQRKVECRAYPSTGGAS